MKLRPLLTVLVLLTVFGCASESPSPSNRAAVSVNEDLLAVERHADDLYGAIWGTALQKEAAHYLNFRALNDPLKDCMAKRGLTFTPRYDPIWAGYRPNGTSSEWMGALHRAPSVTALAMAQSLRHEVDPPPLSEEETSSSYDKGIRACGEPDVDSAPLLQPSTTEDLGYALDEIVYDVDDNLGDIDIYTSCMSQEGVDYTKSGEQGWHGLYLYLSDAMPPLPPLPGEEPTEEWSAYLDLEDQVLDSDAKCRGDRYAQGLATLAPLLDAFETKHADKLAETEADWRDIVERAEKLGFEPAKYQLGS